MSVRLTRALIAIGALIVLGSVGWEIYGKERVIRGGETIYLELAPVDPRSLMQGDYMALGFRLADEVAAWRAVGPRGRLRTAPLQLDECRVATLAEGGSTLQIAFRIRGGSVWLGTNAYFFAEGTGDRYTLARYGEFRIDPATGEAVLVGLRDAELEAL
jgi:uncharacterized membrane-anchored protein